MRFSLLAEFFLIYGDGIVERPWLGRIHTINFVYSTFLSKHGQKWNEDLDVFYDLLQRFNYISNDALEFRTTFERPGVELVFVNRLKVELMKKLPSMGVFTAPVPFTIKGFEPDWRASLNDLLAPKAKSDWALLLIDDDAQAIWDLLEQPTATEVLAAERAKLITVKKAFYHACDDTTHNQVLAKLCFNSRSLGHNFLELPTNAKVRKIINANRTQLPKGVFNCQKHKVHYLPLITNSTDVNLGNCSYLDTCHKLRSCRYVHFYTLNPLQQEEDHLPNPDSELAIDYTIGVPGIVMPVLPPQWICCDVRKLPFSVLGKFAAIISDPAWDIHMSLPYATCKDAELLSLPMNELQDEGVLFLWVTGRSIEIGRKALAQWGYTISDEMIWIKLNQLRRTIVTGRTGHWINHSKENLIVGIKGNPFWLNRKVDLDYIVSGTRETSRKPDELYDIVERLVGKHARKLEIFGRDHNIRDGWFTIGNQLTGTSIYEEEVLKKYNQHLKHADADTGGGGGAAGAAASALLRLT